jgi:hypothetical protein
LGCTLWSHVPKEAELEVWKSLNDYHQIVISEDEKNRKITVQDTNDIHKEELNFLVEEIQKAKENKEVVVVLTHHAPLTKGTSEPQYEKETRGINYAFATDLKSMMGSPIFLWAFG